MPTLLADRNNGENIMETFHHLHSSFQTKTCSVQSANGRLTEMLPYGASVLRTLWKLIIPMIADCNAGKDIDPKAWNCQDSFRKLVKRLKDGQLIVYADSEKDCDDSFTGQYGCRWAYEDRPESEGRSPSFGMQAVVIDPFNEEGRF